MTSLLDSKIPGAAAHQFLQILAGECHRRTLAGEEVGGKYPVGHGRKRSNNDRRTGPADDPSLVMRGLRPAHPASCEKMDRRAEPGDDRVFQHRWTAVGLDRAIVGMGFASLNPSYAFCATRIKESRRVYDRKL